MLKQFKINLSIENNSIILYIDSNSDLIMLYTMLKTFVNWFEYLPVSVYVLSGNSKTKKSLNKIRNVNIWDFLDYTYSVETTFVFDSEVYSRDNVIGWEVRFALDIDAANVDSKIIQGVEVYRGLIEKLKKTNDL